MTISLTPSTGSGGSIPLDSGGRVKGSNLQLSERANVDGTLRNGYDVVSIPNGDTYYWELTIGSAPDTLALLSRFITAFEASGIKYSVWDGSSSSITPLPSPDIERLPTDPGIIWRRINSPTPLPSVRLDYTTIPESGGFLSSAGGVEGFKGLRVQPNDFTFVLSAENLSGATVEFTLKLEWIKTTDPNYF